MDGVQTGDLMATFARGHSARTVLVRHVQTTTVTTIPNAKVTWIHDPSDSRTLRGIPAIGRGVAGCITGTNPANIGNCQHPPQ